MSEATSEASRKNHGDITVNVTTGVYEQVISTGLNREYGCMRFATKIIARLVGCSPRSSENWLRAECAPRGAELIRLMQVNDNIADDIFRLTPRGRELMRRAGINDVPDDIQIEKASDVLPNL